MRLPDLLVLLKSAPLVASVQADDGTPLDAPEAIVRLAQSSLQEGVKALRLQGVVNIRAVRSATEAPTIGLIKRRYDDSEIYITASEREVDELLETGCEVIALDATQRRRPGEVELGALIERIHQSGKLVMADCDSPNALLHAVKCGADLLSTTLSGYTDDSPSMVGPDFELLRTAVATGKPTLAEGRYAEPWQVEAARLIGACGVVVGGALNDPIKQTRRFAVAAGALEEPVAAVDIGGTWMRYALVDAEGHIVRRVQAPIAPTFAERLTWISENAALDGATAIGVSTGGTVDPKSMEMVESKPIIPDNVGRSFWPLLSASGVQTIRAANDGLATAWGHYCHYLYAGRRVATLALGTGVGFGLVDRGQILMGAHGGYPRLNDTATPSGASFESLLGGASLTSNPSPEQKEAALEAGRYAVELIHNLYFPDDIVVCGGVGLADWFDIGLPKSPFGADAGLMGAAALVRYRPW